jgi:hypothetical protein
MTTFILSALLLPPLGGIIGVALTTLLFVRDPATSLDLTAQWRGRRAHANEQEVAHPSSRAVSPIARAAGGIVRHSPPTGSEPTRDHSLDENIVPDGNIASRS